MPLRKILIVDDSATDRQHLEGIVTAAGYAVITAASGREALRMVSSERPDVVLLDIVMADMNGFEVCRAITANTASKDTPVVLVSSKGERTDHLWGAAQGARGYITKPYSAEQILTELASLGCAATLAPSRS